MRPMIKYIKENMKGNLVGVEIGVAKGKHAYEILANLNIERLYLIDPWVNKNEQNQAQTLLNPFVDKVYYITKEAEEAHKGVPNELDFVYVNGNHELEYVMKDINLYYPKVKKGGVFGGHDLSTQIGHAGVVKAFLTLLEREKPQYCRASYTDWWVVKE